ncbi:hypothetical protein DBR06_SOUSAS12710027, partial [Sousa chinensis]
VTGPCLPSCTSRGVFLSTIWGNLSFAVALETCLRRKSHLTPFLEYKRFLKR